MEQGILTHLSYCHQFSREWRGDFQGYIAHMRQYWARMVLSPEERHLLNHLAEGGGYNPVWPSRGEPPYSWLAKWVDDTRATISDSGKLFLYFTEGG